MARHTCSDTISYMPKKRQLSELKGIATIQKRVLRTAVANAPCGPIPPQTLLYLVGLTLPYKAV